MTYVNPILYAEDDENDALFFQTALKKAGVTNPLVHKENGHDALAYLEGAGAYADRSLNPLPCLLITDLKMPIISGFELLARAKPILDQFHIPAIVLSASVAKCDRERCLQLGASAYFSKPSEFTSLAALALELKKSWLAPVMQHA